MRVGLQLPSFMFPGGPAAIRPTLTAIAQSAEANGFASLWVMDHLLQLPEDTGLGGPEQPMLEAYTTLGFLAAATDRIALGPMVGNAVLRTPGLLVKAATTLDVLAGDRPTYFAVGAGWYGREATGLGLPFPPRAERFERLEETLRIARAMFADDRTPIEGRHHRLAEPINLPAPLSRPRIMVGGGGERKTLRLVAEYADARATSSSPIPARAATSSRCWRDIARRSDGTRPRSRRPPCSKRICGRGTRRRPTWSLRSAPRPTRASST